MKIMSTRPHGNTIHGESRRGRKTRTYLKWESMLRRCNNKNQPSYANYGARGIKVCTRWHTFAYFLADMGKCPDGFSIERIDNDGNYEPGNCRWATRKEQARNKRDTHWLTYNGQTKSLAEWSEITGIKIHTILMRISRSKWPVEKALTTAALTPRQAGDLGSTHLVDAVARLSGHNPGTVRKGKKRATA